MNQDAEDLDDGVKKLIGKTISHVWVDMNDGELEFHLSTNNVLLFGRSRYMYAHLRTSTIRL